MKSERREYPEASFCKVGVMATGLMGKAYRKTKWSEMSHIPIKRNDISVRHEGNTKTIFSNNSDPRLQWKACFSGAYEMLKINGNPVIGNTEKLIINGENITWVGVTVGSGVTIIVETNL